VEGEDGVTFVDQHALHERWNYEKLLDREHPVNSQRLLMPAVVELSPAEAAWFAEALPVLRELGFEVERFGDAALSVSAVPEIVRPGQVETLVRDVFADIEAGSQALTRLRERICASLACRAAVLAGRGLVEEQALALIEKFAEARQPLTCPHGRPTSFTLSWEELERRFGRR